MLRHLTDDEKKAVRQRMSPTAGWVPWPEWAPKQYNACTDPCDMWTGPCACGAWHKDGD